jgi:formate dehydrogenase maturation protein FdhE
VVPAVVEATAAAGPPALRDAVLAHPAGAELEAVLGGWLAGAELDPVDRYLARASLTPVLEALGDRAGTACDGRHEGEGGIRCPSCGGQPQLSYLASSGDSLAAGQRSLLCARCNSSWSCSRSTCPACAQTDEAQLTVYSEHWEGGVSGNGKGEHEPQPTFPHLRVAGCESCRRYLIEVDLGRDARAVPEVDELVALPLDLYAAEQQLTKVTPNLMGF